MRTIIAKKGFADLSKVQRTTRWHELTGMMKTAAGGEEHVVSLMLHHKKANLFLYLQLGLKERVVLSCEKLVFICVRMSTSVCV